MRTGRPRIAVMLNTAERQHLTSLAHRSRSAPHVARRARIVLACAAGRPTTQIARRLQRLRDPRPGRDGLLLSPSEGE